MVKMNSTMSHDQGSTETSVPHGGEPVLDDDTSMDFVVLSNPANNPSLNGSVPSLKDIVNITSTEVLDSTTQDLQIKIKELIQENLNLKESMEANNMEMRKQVALLATWKENMDHINSEHKKIIYESREHIRRLKSERDGFATDVEKLKSELETVQEDVKRLSEFESKCKQLTHELNKLEDLNKKLEDQVETHGIVKLQLEQEVSSKTLEIEELKKEVETLKDENNKLTMNHQVLQVEFIALETKLAQAEEEHKAFTESTTKSQASETQTASGEIQQSSIDLQLPKLSHKDALVSLQHEQEKVASLTKQLAEEQSQLSLLQKELDERSQNVYSLKEQIEMLKNSNQAELQDAQGDGYVCVSLQKGGKSLMEIMRAAEQKFIVANSLIQAYKDKCDALSAYLVAYQDRFKGEPHNVAFIKELEERVREMYTVLQEEQATKQEDRRQLNEALSKLEGLFGDYQTLLSAWEKFQEDQKTKCQHLEAVNEIDARKYQEQIDFLMASNVSLKQDIESRDEEIKDLKFQLENLPILRSQVEILRGDIEKEKNLRVQLEGEVQRWKDEAQRAMIERQQAAGALYYLQHTDNSAGALPSYLDTFHQVDQQGATSTLQGTEATSYSETRATDYSPSSLHSTRSRRFHTHEVSRRKEHKHSKSERKSKPSKYIPAQDAPLTLQTFKQL